ILAVSPSSPFRPDDNTIYYNMFVGDAQEPAFTILYSMTRASEEPTPARPDKPDARAKEPPEPPPSCSACRFCGRFDRTAPVTYGSRAPYNARNLARPTGS